MADTHIVTVRYYQEQAGHWWGSTEREPHWSGTAATLDELRQLAEEGLAFALSGSDRPVEVRSTFFWRLWPGELIQVWPDASETFAIGGPSRG